MEVTPPAQVRTSHTISHTMCCLGVAWGRRYKKKVEKDEEYIKQVKALTSAIESDIKQNYSIDIYQVRARCASRSAEAVLLAAARLACAAARRRAR